MNGEKDQLTNSAPRDPRQGEQEVRGRSVLCSTYRKGPMWLEITLSREAGVK